MLYKYYYYFNNNYSDEDYGHDPLWHFQLLDCP